MISSKDLLFSESFSLEIGEDQLTIVSDVGTVVIDFNDLTYLDVLFFRLIYSLGASVAGYPKLKYTKPK